MRTGLVIGKFYPPHKGHLALIQFARERCDRLIVSMSYTEQDSISIENRFAWLKQLLSENENIEVHKILDNFDDDSLELDLRTKIWADIIRLHYGKIDMVASSENYGPSFAKNLGATHHEFDVDRLKYSISASLIRSNPFQHWNFIPDNVKPHFVKKICLYGPESTGKSTMAEELARHYRTEFVPEVARELIKSNNFNREDIIEIGRKQTERVFEKLKTANKVLFCDTDLITTQIYSRHYLKVVPPILYQLESIVSYDHYFLFEIDVAWVEDGLRDLGNLRKEMFDVFKEALERRKISYTLVHGDWKNRSRIIREKIDKLLQEVNT